MRVVFGFLGFLAGAVAGLVLTVLALFLWYDVLRISDHGGDGLNGMASFMTLGPLLALAGGVGGALWLANSARTGAKAGPVVAMVVLLLVLVYLVIGPMFM